MIHLIHCFMIGWRLKPDWRSNPLHLYSPVINQEPVCQWLSFAIFDLGSLFGSFLVAFYIVDTVGFSVLYTQVILWPFMASCLLWYKASIWRSLVDLYLISIYTVRFGWEIVLLPLIKPLPTMVYDGRYYIKGKHDTDERFFHKI